MKGPQRNILGPFLRPTNETARFDHGKTGDLGMKPNTVTPTWWWLQIRSRKSTDYHLIPATNGLANILYATIQPEPLPGGSLIKSQVNRQRKVSIDKRNIWIRTVMNDMMLFHTWLWSFWGWMPWVKRHALAAERQPRWWTLLNTMMEKVNFSKEE